MKSERLVSADKSIAVASKATEQGVQGRLAQHTVKRVAPLLSLPPAGTTLKTPVPAAAWASLWRAGERPNDTPRPKTWQAAHKTWAPSESFLASRMGSAAPSASIAETPHSPLTFESGDDIPRPRGGHPSQPKPVPAQPRSAAGSGVQALSGLQTVPAHSPMVVEGGDDIPRPKSRQKSKPLEKPGSLPARLPEALQRPTDPQAPFVDQDPTIEVLLERTLHQVAQAPGSMAPLKARQLRVLNKHILRLRSLNASNPAGSGRVELGVCNQAVQALATLSENLRTRKASTLLTDREVKRIHEHGLCLFLQSARMVCQSEFPKLFRFRQFYEKTAFEERSSILGSGPTVSRFGQAPADRGREASTAPTQGQLQPLADGAQVKYRDDGSLNPPSGRKPSEAQNEALRGQGRRTVVSDAWPSYYCNPETAGSVRIRPADRVYYHEKQSGPFCQTCCINNYLGGAILTPEVVEELSAAYRQALSDHPSMTWGQTQGFLVQLQRLLEIQSEKMGLPRSFVEPILPLLDCSHCPVKAEPTRNDQTLSHAQSLADQLTQSPIERMMINFQVEPQGGGHAITLRRKPGETTWTVLDSNYEPFGVDLSELFRAWVGSGRKFSVFAPKVQLGEALSKTEHGVVTAGLPTYGVDGRPALFALAEAVQRLKATDWETRLSTPSVSPEERQLLQEIKASLRWSKAQAREFEACLTTQLAQGLRRKASVWREFGTATALVEANLEAISSLLPAEEAQALRSMALHGALEKTDPFFKKLETHLAQQARQSFKAHILEKLQESSLEIAEKLQVSEYLHQCLAAPETEAVTLAAGDRRLRRALRRFTEAAQLTFSKPANSPFQASGRVRLSQFGPQ